MKRQLLNVARMIRLLIVWLASRNRLLGRVFFLFEPSFDREFEFTLRGRHEALSSRYRLDHSNANVRRCVHRLEKGLFHRDRRAAFGKDVLTELAHEISKLDLLEEGADANEVDWAIATLTSYRPHAYDPALVDDCLYRLERFRGFGPEPESLRRPDTKVSPDFEVLRRLYYKRESVRFFTDRPVDPELVVQAVAIAKEAPSACNRQPFHLHLLTDTRDIEFVGGLAPGTAGFLNNIPVLGVLIGHASAFRFTRDRHLIYTDGGLFLGHLLPALTALSLDTCVLNWTPDWTNDRKAVDYLGLDMSKTIVCLLAIGYRDDTASPISTKKTNDNLLRTGA
ncbi:nitroreductase family protein [Pelagovum sp. HNIBRBA483]|uniref:nitroreductase family protein n=1 Tax=Pelagovum sp. HNIBRBA483 TaxID=3233341 RepID=UPI0034A587F9